MARRPPPTEPVFLAEIAEAKPNPMFNEEQRATIRFLRYTQMIPCAVCGKRRKTHWTMLCSFQAHNVASFVVEAYALILLPLAPVCRDHPLAPAVLPA